MEPQTGAYRTSVEVDPFSISLEDKIAHCLRADAALQRAEGDRARGLRARPPRAARAVSSEGAAVEHELVECGGGVDALASDGTLSQARSYPSAHTGSSAQGGWEV